MKRYSLGLDFGTLSARAILVDIGTGEEVESASFPYPHGVMDRALPSGKPLPPHFALAHPADYLSALFTVVPQVMRQSGVQKEEVVGIGIDATASSLVPVDRSFTPLCLLPEFSERPNAYIKLWKHHGETALLLSDRLTEAAQSRGEPWRTRYGNRFNGENLLPKALETLVLDPELFSRCHRLLELGDWLTQVLTGEEVRSLPTASCNCLYDREAGYPSPEFFREVLPGSEAVLQKLAGRMVPLGGRAGGLAPEAARRLGLLPATPVSAPLIDCHAAVPGCGAGEDGDLVMVLGTSSCFLLNSSRGGGIPDIYSSAYEAHIPGLYGFEGGQSSAGDSFEWFLSACVPSSLGEEARRSGEGLYSLLERRAAALAPGESGLLALDWWSGVRTPLLDYDLSGALLGLELSTTPEEIYRALLESVCFGARRIVECYQTAGKGIRRVFAAGGLAHKNRLMMQILSDVLGREILVAPSAQSCALGSAVMGAYAALGGDFGELLGRMCRPPQLLYRPDPDRVRDYQTLYEEYDGLFRYFSRENRLTQRLRRTKLQKKARRAEQTEVMSL